MIVLLVLSGIAWTSTGCGTLANLIGRSQDAVGFQTEGAPAVEPEPKIPPELMERVREQVDYARSVLQGIRSEWVQVATAATQQAAQGLQFTLAVLGQPARPIDPGADLNASDPTVQAALREGQGLLEDHRKEEYQWHDAMADASREPAKRTWRIWSGPLWMYLTFGVGGAGALLLGMVRKLWGYRKGFIQLVSGGVALIAGNPVAGVAFKVAMLGATDKPTQALIQKVETREDVQAQAAKIARNTSSPPGPGGSP